MTTRQTIEDWLDKYARDSVPSERIDELVRELETLFRDTAKGCVPEYMTEDRIEGWIKKHPHVNSNLDENSKYQATVNRFMGYNTAIDHFNQNIEEKMK